MRPTLSAILTAVAGGAFVFIGVYLLFGFVAIRATEGSRLEWVGVALTLVVSAGAAVASFRASLRRSGKDPAA